jgi:hypothetical protein
MLRWIEHAIIYGDHMQFSNGEKNTRRNIKEKSSYE